MDKDGRGKTPAPEKIGRLKTSAFPGPVNRSAESVVSGEILSVFGANLRAARIERGMTQIELAKASGVTQRRVSLIENGQQDVMARTMESLAKALDLDLRDLLGDPRQN